MIDFSLDSRNRSLDSADTADLLVVGGGITGAGVALDAVSRGLKVLLIEKGDFVSGTSGRTTKLIHGGLRYLRQLRFGLVREASRERALLRKMAPHLVEEIEFIIPVARKLHRLGLGPGLWMYDALGGFRSKRHRFLSEREASEELRGMPVAGAYLYSDSKADDCRLTLHVLKKAVQLGARAAHYIEALEIRKDGARVADRLRGREMEIKARHVVIAAGVWTDALLGGGAPRVRPTKGVHIVIPRKLLGNRRAILMPSPEDHRVLFAVPWGDHDIVGTTDTDYTGPLDRPRAEAEDIAYLVSKVHQATGVRLAPGDIVSTYAGLRPLVASDDAKPSDASRDFAVFDAPPGVTVVTGGKLTTFRSMARKVVDRFSKEPSTTHELDLFSPQEETSPDLARAYGSEAKGILERAAIEGLRPIHESNSHRRAEIDYCVRSEACVTVADFLSRRTRAVLFLADQGRASAPAVADRMAKLLNWDAAEKTRQVDMFDRELEMYGRSVPTISPP